MCVAVRFNRLNTELNPVCHLLALLEAHRILHVSRIRVSGQVAEEGMRVFENMALNEFIGAIR
jgi:hypothetical protein